MVEHEKKGRRKGKEGKLMRANGKLKCGKQNGLRIFWKINQNSKAETFSN